ncbi:hypothetical protein A9R00_10295 [Oleispira antarctica]|uniref:Thioredoxin domain-containing protein n=1 Tax=Oleispira antarctica TaxID=188908 RepID=A0A1Y5HNQ6_OLEAN|nr:hypothetical protein A9R00_10295 [Oleispira antarctica]
MYDSNFTAKFAVNYMIPLQLPLWLTESSNKNIDIDTLLNDVVLTAANSATNSATKSTDDYLLYVGAPWCAPCKGLRPVLINILASYGDLPCYEINLDESLNYQQSKLLRSLPALILYRANAPIQQVNGLVSSDKIHQLLRFNGGSDAATSDSTTETTAELIAISQLTQKIQSGNIDEALSFYCQLNRKIKYQSNLQQIKSLIDLILDSKKQLQKLSPKDDLFAVYNLFSQALVSSGLNLLLQLPAQSSINRQLYVKGINTLTDKQQAKHYRQQLGYFN